LPKPNGIVLLLLAGAPELDLGRAGSDFLEVKYEPGELLCWLICGRGTLAKRLSSEPVSVEDGRVEVDPC
jgi:hypothetical protein